jgi:membrane-bound transcription factor site-1 protease
MDGETSRYIVAFREYHDVDKHSGLLSAILGGTAWQHIPRKNPATRQFPSDFALVFLGRAREQIETLLLDPSVKRVTKDTMYSRPTAEKASHGTHPPPNVCRARRGTFGLTSWSRLERTPDGEHRYNKYRAPPFPFATDPWDGKGAPSLRRRRLTWGSSGDQERRYEHQDYAGDITGAFKASLLWKAGHTGKGIKVAVFDTGIRADHSHFHNIEERTNWTDEPSLGDGLGHGTFVAGVIASHQDCLGFAPDASIYTYRVFTDQQVSFTSWFLDAFNYAIFREMDVLNLSIGGPDWLDIPFTEKVEEAVAHKIVVVSAIGNDGPLWGTLNSPADMPFVLGVGGVDNYFDMASFASRGMSTHELPEGYGRMKPDVVSFSAGLRGSSTSEGCRRLGGTSVASPVIAGAVTLLASVLPIEKRATLLNPATIKQIIVESAEPIKQNGKHTASIFEQGAGLLNLQRAYELALKAVPRASLHPSIIDMTDCTYMWPYCSQHLYADAMPVVVNFTLLNGMGVTGRVVSPPVFTATQNGDRVAVKFTFSSVVWPWVGYVGAHITVPSSARAWTGTVEGRVSVVVESPPPLGSPAGSLPLRHTAEATLRLLVVPTPPRKKRVLWDQFHNVRYPVGFFPRDNLDDHDEALDWHGDHVHTNFHGLYDHLREKGFFVEVLSTDFTCFDAEQYGTLLVVDAEEEYFPEEVEKLEHDIRNGLGLVVFADWYEQDVLEKIRFFDENTRDYWTAATGGANVPALNDLLRPFGVAFGTRTLTGSFKDGEGHRKVRFLSGSAIARFPAGGRVVTRSMNDQASSFLNRGSHEYQVSIAGVVQPADSKGRLAVYGDSNCLDSNHMRGGDCYWVLDSMLKYTMDGAIDETMQDLSTVLKEGMLVDKDAGLEPKRRPNCETEMRKYSKVIGAGKKPQCATKKSAPETAG